MSGWCCGAGGWAMALGLILLTALIVGAITLIRALRWRGGGNRGQESPGEGTRYGRPRSGHREAISISRSSRSVEGAPPRGFRPQGLKVTKSADLLTLFA